MRAVFLGTPAAAVPALAALVQIADVAVVITQPDAPRGRSRRLASPPIKVAAVEWGIEVSQPTDDAQLLSTLRREEIDVGVVVAYGRILSRPTLDTTRFGFANVHFSLLPRWRGAAPVARAILAGDDLTGVSLMVLEEGLDTGPVIAVTESPIDDDETGGMLTARLSYLGADLLSAALPEYLAGKRQPAAQIGAGASHARRLTAAEAVIDPMAGAQAIVRKVRAFNPRPGAWLRAGDTRLKVLEASGSDEVVQQGSIALLAGEAVLGVPDGSVVLNQVQAEGRTSMSGGSWLRGLRVDEIAVESVG